MARRRARIQPTLRLLRQAQQKTLQQLAEEVGVGHNTVSGWERGMHVPNAMQLGMYARALGASTEDCLRLLLEARAKMPVAAAEPKESAV